MKSRLFNFVATVVYVASVIVIYLDLFVWRP
jgi:hypothetical protein